MRSGAFGRWRRLTAERFDGRTAAPVPRECRRCRRGLSVSKQFYRAVHSPLPLLPTDFSPTFHRRFSGTPNTSAAYHARSPCPHPLSRAFCLDARSCRAAKNATASSCAASRHELDKGWKVTGCAMDETVESSTATWWFAAPKARSKRRQA